MYIISRKRLVKAAYTGALCFICVHDNDSALLTALQCDSTKNIPVSVGAFGQLIILLSQERSGSTAYVRALILRLSRA